MSDSLRLYGQLPARLLCPWDPPGKNTEVGCHSLLQGILQTQGLSLRVLCLLHWQVGSLLLVPPGKPGQVPRPLFTASATSQEVNIQDSSPQGKALTLVSRPNQMAVRGERSLRARWGPGTLLFPQIPS